MIWAILSSSNRHTHPLIQKMFSGRQGSRRQGRVCKYYHYWKSSCFNSSTKQHLTLHNLPFGGRSVQKVLTFVKMFYTAVNKILFPGGRKFKFCSLLWSELLTCGNIKVFKRKVWNWSLLHAEPTQHPHSVPVSFEECDVTPLPLPLPTRHWGGRDGWRWWWHLR